MKWFNFYYRTDKWRKLCALMAVLAASMPKFLKRLLNSQLHLITIFILFLGLPTFGFALAQAYCDGSNIGTEWKKSTSHYAEFFREYKPVFVILYLTCSCLLLGGLRVRSRYSYTSCSSLLRWWAAQEWRSKPVTVAPDGHLSRINWARVVCRHDSCASRPMLALVRWQV